MSTPDPCCWAVPFAKENLPSRHFRAAPLATGHWPRSESSTAALAGGRTFHLLLQGEAAVDPLELRLHRQPANVCLQVCPVHHADPEHDQGDMLRLRGHQAALSLRLRHAVIVLFVLKHHFARRLRGAPNSFRRKWKCWGQTGNVRNERTPQT